MAHAKDISLKKSLEITHAYFRIDKALTKQVLINLLGNAIKFTPESGSVELRVREENSRLIFEVEDNGAGIESSAISRLFTPFEQANTSITRKFGGTGLGLSICKNIADLLGGDISVESTLGNGSVFTFSFPAESVNVNTTHPIRSSKAVTSPTDSTESVQCFIIDDNEVNCRVIQATLKNMGHSSDYTTSAEEGLERIKAGQYQMLLLDLHMPEMSGYEVYDKIKTEMSDIAESLYVVAFTADASKDTKIKYREFTV